jgi:hypothetical protein
MILFKLLELLELLFPAVVWLLLELYYAEEMVVVVAVVFP